MATANVVSDCKLVDESLERKYDCPVCLQILRDPCKSLCCGNDFCHACVRKLQKEDNPCPLCRNSMFRIKRNRDLSSEIYRLQVYCVNKAKGCDWEGCLGEIDVHLNQNPTFLYQTNGCCFVHVQCPHCSQNFQRRQICDHFSICPRRPYQCEYCQAYNSFYEDVIHNHWPDCKCYPVLCPNGCTEHIHRHNMNNHIAKDCPMTVVECEFKQYGCTAKLTRRDMSSHMKNSVAAHESLVVMTKVFTQLKKNSRDIQELEAKLHEKQRHLIREQKDLFEKKIASATNEVIAAGQKQLDSMTESSFEFSKRNKRFMKEQRRALNLQISGATDDIEEAVWIQVEQRMTSEFADQVKELRAEINQIRDELEALQRYQTFTAWVYNRVYRPTERFFNTLEEVFESVFCLLLVLLFIYWLGLPLVIQIICLISVPYGIAHAMHGR